MRHTKWIHDFHSRMFATFLRKLNSLATTFYENEQTYFVDYQSFIDKYPSGFLSIDEHLSTTCTPILDISQLPALEQGVDLPLITLQNFENAILTLNEDVLSFLSSEDRDELKIVDATQAFQLNVKILEKYEKYMAHKRVKELEVDITLLTFDEFKLIVELHWGDSMIESNSNIKTLFSNIPRTSDKQSRGFLSLLSFPDKPTGYFEEKCRILYDGLRRSSGIFYVQPDDNFTNKYIIVKNTYGSCSFCAEPSLPFENDVSFNVNWSFYSLFDFASYTPTTYHDFESTTGLLPVPATINKGNNKKINDYILNKTFLLPLANTLCKEKNTNYMYSTETNHIADVTYVQLPHSTIPIIRQSSLLLMIADLAVTLNCDPFDGIFFVETFNTTAIGLIWVVIAVAIVLAILLWIYLNVYNKNHSQHRPEDKFIELINAN